MSFARHIRYVSLSRKFGRLLGVVATVISVAIASGVIAPRPSAAAGGNLPSKGLFYPVPSADRLRVTDEDYLPDYMTLVGLKGVYFELASINGFVEKHKTSLGLDLEDEIRRRLERVGLKMLTKEEAALTPGQPQFDVWPKFDSTCCDLGFWSMLTQGGRLLREPHRNFRMGTWGDGAEFGGDQGDCPDLGQWLATEVLKKVDHFVADYSRAMNEAPKLPANAKPLPQVSYPECNTALLLYVQMFNTGSSAIGRRQRGILNELATSIKRCDNYRYLVETHADQRGSAKFNLKLSRKRSQAIAVYLVSRGVSQDRFEVRYHGEAQLVTDGTSRDDYAANRRVVITPFKSK